MGAPEASPGSRRLRASLWVAALVLALLAAAYQRRTGPTRPVPGTCAIAGQTIEYELPRTWTTGEDARVLIPASSEAVRGTLVFRRYPTEEPFTRAPLVREDDVLVGRIPSQPPAGKVEYHVVLSGGGEEMRLPPVPEDDPVLRYKGSVPAGVLIPHIALVFLALLMGVRAGLSAVFGHDGTRRLAWVTAALLTVGGMFFGPVVQKHAFGAYWTGWPNGHDLTDNKMLVMWLVWILAAVLAGLRARPRVARPAIVLATVVMLVVYLIPHSLRGSQLNYDKLEEGASATEAVETG